MSKRSPAIATHAFTPAPAPKYAKAVAPGEIEIAGAHVGGVWVKQVRLNTVGASAIQHRHAHDHLTLLVAGRVAASVNGTTRTFAAPQIIVVRAGAHHSFTALEPHTLIYCIHALPMTELEPEYLAPDMELEAALTR